ncbi:MAG: UDP-glucose--hexose-1-phosphate uridylyltransferase [Ignavibacteria bacterium]
MVKNVTIKNIASELHLSASTEQTHRRYNPLLDEWLLVSPHRTQRPWQGKVEKINIIRPPDYEKDCYLCPNNKRANGEINPNYKSTFVFDNDFSALKKDVSGRMDSKSELLKAKTERGVCRVVCFSPRHSLTLAEMALNEIEEVVKTWKREYSELGKLSFINYVQIFENKGEIMGCSNPHPHGQIWAQESIPNGPTKEQFNQQKYWKKNGKTLLSDYLKIEKENNERIIYENDSFVLLVPYWAVWPFETLIISKRTIGSILQFNEKEDKDFAEILKATTVKYDNVFNVSFPYSSGIHQSPTDGTDHEEWHFHMHFYPPLLRSAAIKKFMVGYELLAEPQRDIAPERSAEILKQADSIHFSLRKS